MAYKKILFSICQPKLDRLGRFLEMRFRIYILLITMTLCCLNCSDWKDGGPCTYEQVKGKAKILEVEKKENIKDQDHARMRKVKIDFTPDVNNTEKSLKAYKRFYDTKSKISLKTGMNEDYEFRAESIAKNNIKSGMIILASVSLVTSGTCTPIIWSFEGLIKAW